MSEKANQATGRQSSSYIKVNSILLTETGHVCRMYLTVLQTVTQLKVQVTAGRIISVVIFTTSRTNVFIYQLLQVITM